MWQAGARLQRMASANPHKDQAIALLDKARVIGYTLDKAHAAATLAVAEELAGLRRDIQALTAALTTGRRD